MDYRGLVFTDIKTGEVVPRCVVDYCAMGSIDDCGLLTSGRTIEVPPRDSETSYQVMHRFKKNRSLPKRETSIEEELRQQIKPGQDHPLAEALHKTRDSGQPSLEEELFQSLSQINGFSVGRSYTISLGENMSRVRWWRKGRRDGVCAGGRSTRAVASAGANLSM